MTDKTELMALNETAFELAIGGDSNLSETHKHEARVFIEAYLSALEAKNEPIEAFIEKQENGITTFRYVYGTENEAQNDLSVKNESQ